MIQRYEWGTIEWLTDQRRSTSETLDIGITTILPGCAQERHIHYGDEQWLYVLSGSGISVVDQVSTQIRSGDSFHIPPGAVHETRNTGSGPLRELLISYPKLVDELGEETGGHFKSAQDMIDVSDQALRLSPQDIDIARAYGETLALPITIYDTLGHALFTWGDFPKPCTDLCGIDEDLTRCHIYAQEIYYRTPAYSEQSAHYCKYGLAVIDTPMVIGNQMIGNIRGGHIPTEDNPPQNDHDLGALVKHLESVPKGRLRIILNQYKKLADQLSKAHQRELAARMDEIGRTEESSSVRALKEDLNMAIGRILNLQINNHFLFNTLNAIAGLALEEDSFKTYRSIIDLSKLFRYSLRTSQEFVSIRDEMEHVKNYSELQKIRYGESLNVNISVPEGAMKYYIPFNTLQPIVENAFIHGFRNFRSEMAIEIELDCSDHVLELVVRDNGQGMSENLRRKLAKRLECSDSRGRGLSMVFNRMRLFFGSEFSFELSSEENGGFEVKLVFPKRALREDMVGGLS